MNNAELEDVYKKLDEEIPLEIKTYHATKKDIWITEGQSDGETLCAKSVKYETGYIKYYVKRCGCEFYDNGHISPVYKRRLWRLAPVSQQAFELYLAFLGFRDPRNRGQSYIKLRGERCV